MGKLVDYERYVWFDQEVRTGRFPKAPDLVVEFGISLRTARRAIDTMRIMYGAPLDYDKRRRGFYYSDDSFSLPPLWVSQEEMLAVLIARNLLSSCAGGVISDAIGRMGKKLLAQGERLGLPLERLDERFSAVWLNYAPSQAGTFQGVARALLGNRLLRFTYTSPKEAGAVTRREVEPHHLQHYMGSWVLLAFCRTRQDWRKFMLSRVGALEDAGASFSPRPVEEWRPFLSGGYGIFQGGELVELRLRFSPGRARWMREQVWHPEQRLEEQEDGGLILVLPVTDFREIRLRILQYGADAEVLAPASLRREMMAEVGRLRELYRL